MGLVFDIEIDDLIRIFNFVSQYISREIEIGKGNETAQKSIMSTKFQSIIEYAKILKLIEHNDKLVRKSIMPDMMKEEPKRGDFITAKTVEIRLFTVSYDYQVALYKYVSDPLFVNDIKVINLVMSDMIKDECIDKNRILFILNSIFSNIIDSISISNTPSEAENSFRSYLSSIFSAIIMSFSFPDYSIRDFLTSDNKLKVFDIFMRLMKRDIEEQSVFYDCYKYPYFSAYPAYEITTQYKLSQFIEILILYISSGEEHFDYFDIIENYFLGEEYAKFN